MYADLNAKADCKWPPCTHSNLLEKSVSLSHRLFGNCHNCALLRENRTLSRMHSDQGLSVVERLNFSKAGVIEQFLTISVDEKPTSVITSPSKAFVKVIKVEKRPLIQQFSFKINMPTQPI